MTDMLVIIVLVMLLVAIGMLGVLLRRVQAAGKQNAPGELERVERSVREEISTNRAELAKAAATQRQELSAGLDAFSTSVGKKITDIAMLQQGELKQFGERLDKLTQTSDARLETIRATIEARLAALQADNAAKLDQMRATVDEKLQGTLEKRLSESFRLVSDRLEQVHKGLGEMQSLAVGVGDLKRVLSNVKVRGVWGEFQLGSLLEELLAPDQFIRNCRTRKGGNDPVEFAVRLPGRNGEEVLLPIDSKFPQEDFLRLLDAQERCDADATSQAAAALAQRVRKMADDICAKYIDPPHTTDFAILYLPTEGLYAEVLRRPGVIEELQRQCRVAVAGPTTLAALLNSLRMGFQTLAIEKRAGEVWGLLSAIKTDFGRFGDMLDRVRKQLDAASNTIDEAGRKTRTIQRKLKDVAQLPADAAAAALEAEADDQAPEITQ
jgi:DNA recombination protein RmuC